MWILTQKMLSITVAGILFLGSQAEATTTNGLESKIDTILFMRYTVIQNLESWVPGIHSLLVVSDENAPAGYIKLRALRLDLPLPIHNHHCDRMKVDRYGRSVLCNEYLKVSCADEHHGPAYTNFVSEGLSVDCVFAARVFAWPYKASAWLTKSRRHNWPSQSTIDLIQQTGALLIPVGHKHSPENTSGMAIIHFIWGETS